MNVRVKSFWKKYTGAVRKTNIFWQLAENMPYYSCRRNGSGVVLCAPLSSDARGASPSRSVAASFLPPWEADPYGKRHVLLIRLWIFNFAPLKFQPGFDKMLPSLAWNLIVEITLFFWYYEYSCLFASLAPLKAEAGQHKRGWGKKVFHRPFIFPPSPLRQNLHFVTSRFKRRLGVCQSAAASPFPWQGKVIFQAAAALLYSMLLPACLLLKMC